MGMFNDLMGKIFGHAAAKPTDAAGGGAVPESRVQAAARQGVPVGSAIPNPAGSGQPKPGAPMGPVDVGSTLDRLASSHGEKLDWKHSIVDLMKLVGMDSSLSARKDLAQDLHYKGDTNDSAAMNMWLHKEVMRKLAENGGKLPADLDAR